MITRRDLVKQMTFGATLLGVGSLQKLAFADAPIAPDPKTAQGQSAGKGVLVRQIMMQPLTETPGQAAAMVTVDYAPGASTPPHRHPGVVFGYVLEGTIEIGLNSGKPITYHKGDSWYEPPHVIHRVARNPSKVIPARILAFLIVEKGKPLVEPVGVSH